MAELQVLSGPFQSKLVTITGPRFLLGRRRGCHLVLDDGWVSREHTVIIEVAPGEFAVQDLDSENGIFLNGKKVSDAPLRHNDVLRVGRTEMRFVDPPVDGPRPATPIAVLSTQLEEVAHSPTECIVPSEEPGDPMARTAFDLESGHRDRSDLRDRVRRLERLLQAEEDEKRRLAMENAVFKRALAESGLLDRDTGRVREPRAAAPGQEPPLLWLSSFLEPLAQTEEGLSPDAGAGYRSPGFVGLGEVGEGVVKGLASYGHCRSVLIKQIASAEGSRSPFSSLIVEIPALQPGGPASPEPAAAVIDAANLERGILGGLGRDRSVHVLVDSFGRGSRCDTLVMVADFLGDLAAVVQPTADPPVQTALLLVVAEDALRGPPSEGLTAAWHSVIHLRESGKAHPLWLVGEGSLSRLGGMLCRPNPQAHCCTLVASVLDGFFRALEAGVLQGTLTRTGLEQALRGEGFGSFGLGQGPATAEGLKLALEDSLGQGWLGLETPPSRGHEAIFLVGIGSEVLARGGLLLSRLAPLVKGASGLLPQAKTMTSWVGFQGEGIRVLTYVGGLALPERLGSGRRS
ncbi:MAG TPA: FHA domain-containing protein [Planctomycetota bacterium]|nr:FHA domain-containing protein [Planctomycetota bacterium]